MSSVADVRWVGPHLENHQNHKLSRHLNSISRTVVGESLKSHPGLRLEKIEKPLFWPKEKAFKFCARMLNKLRVSVSIHLELWHWASFHGHPPHKDKPQPDQQDVSKMVKMELPLIGKSFFLYLSRLPQLAKEATGCIAGEPVEGFKPVKEGSIILHHLKMKYTQYFILEASHHILTAFSMCGTMQALHQHLSEVCGWDSLSKLATPKLLRRRHLRFSVRAAHFALHPHSMPSSYSLSITLLIVRRSKLKSS